jgi:hypothetical protein
MDFILKLLRSKEDQKARKGMFRPVAVLSDGYNQFAEDVDTYKEARAICIAYSRSYQTYIFDDQGSRLNPWRESVGFVLVPKQ